MIQEYQDYADTFYLERVPDRIADPYPALAAYDHFPPMLPILADMDDESSSSSDDFDYDPEDESDMEIESDASGIIPDSDISDWQTFLLVDS